MRVRSAAWGGWLIMSLLQLRPPRLLVVRRAPGPSPFGNDPCGHRRLPGLDGGRRDRGRSLTAPEGPADSLSRDPDR